MEYLHVDEGLYYYGEDHYYGEGRVSVVMTLEQLIELMLAVCKWLTKY